MIDKILLAGVMILLTLSLVMSYSLSTYAVLHFDVLETRAGQFHFFMRQSVSIFIAFMMMVILSKLDPDKWFARIGILLFVIFFILMIGKCCRWSKKVDTHRTYVHSTR